MNGPFSRTELLLGEDAMRKLAAARVAVFGVGGVGGYAVEALARSGIGAIELIDGDRFAPSNLNRQLHATLETLGQYKAEAAARRIAQINPDAKVTAHNIFYTEETAGRFDFSKYDYVVDAVDMVSAKILLAVNAQAAGTPIISCMGAGNKLDPTAFEVADVYDTSVCPLARIMRRELRRRGITKLKVVYSKEPPAQRRGAAEPEPEGGGSRRQTPGSCAFVPAVAGLILGGEVVRDLIRLG